MPTTFIDDTLDGGLAETDAESSEQTRRVIAGAEYELEQVRRLLAGIRLYGAG